ncbi:hypothetical protein Tco_1337075 [Tanacetum coccineum]
MSRTNPHVMIVSEEHLVPRANKLIIRKNNQHVASDTNITDTMLRIIIGILRHHKLYKSVSLTAIVPVIYLQESLTGKDTSWDTTRLPIIQILLGIIHSTNLDFASLIWDEIEWQAVNRTTKQTKMSKLMYTRFTMLFIDHFLSCNKSIPRRSNSDMHSKAKKAESEKAKANEEPEEQHVSPVRSGGGKGYMRSGDQEENVPSAFKKNDVPRKTRSLIVADNIVEEPVAVELAKSVGNSDLMITKPYMQQ